MSEQDNKPTKVVQELIAGLEVVPLSIYDLGRIAGVKDTTSVRNWRKGVSVPHASSLARLQFAEDMFIYLSEQCGSSGIQVRSVSKQFFFSRHALLEGQTVVDYIGRYGNTRPDQVMRAARDFIKSRLT